MWNRAVKHHFKDCMPLHACRTEDNACDTPPVLNSYDIGTGLRTPQPCKPIRLHLSIRMLVDSVQSILAESVAHV